MTPHMWLLCLYATVMCGVTWYNIRCYRREARSSRRRVEHLIHDDQVRGLRTELADTQRRLLILTEGLSDHPDFLPGAFFESDPELAAPTGDQSPTDATVDR